MYEKLIKNILRENFKKKVSDSAFKLYVVLMRKAELSDWKEVICISQRAIAAEMQWSVQKAHDCIRELAGRKLITYFPGRHNKEYSQIWFPQIPFPEEKSTDVKINNKQKYSENVFLREDEYNSLLSFLGEERTNELIEDLTLYMKAQGKNYESHYDAILIFAKNQEKEGRKNATNSGGADKNNEKDTGSEPKYGYSEELLSRLENE